jgi:hypothetical protein
LRWISVILSDPDPDQHPGHSNPDPTDKDWYQFQANKKVEKLNFFPGKFQYAGKNTENIETF